MPSIERRPSGSWRARYRDPRGRTRSKTFARKADAQRFLNEMATDIEHGNFADPRLTRTTFDQWADEWLAGLDVRQTTSRSYLQALDRLRPEFSDRKVATIDRPAVRRFIAAQRAHGYSPKTIRNTVSVLKMVLDLAVEARALTDNPATNHKLGALRRQDPLIFTVEQVNALADAAKRPYGILILLGAYTGLRPAEICGLRVKRLHLLQRRVEVAETLTPVAGRLVVGPTKTFATRSVPLPTFLADRLDEHLRQRAAAKGRNLEPDDYVFVAEKGGLLRVNKLRELIIRPALEAAGLPLEFRTYDLRHTCASLLIAAGAHPRAIMERLGHSSITTTLDVYGHLFPALEAELTERLQAMYDDATARAVPAAGTVTPLR